MAKVASDTKIDQALRDLALIRQTAFEYDTLKPQTVIARMKPLVDAKDSSWFASAAELSAIAHYQLGQFDQRPQLARRAKCIRFDDAQQSGMPIALDQPAKVLLNPAQHSWLASKKSGRAR